MTATPLHQPAALRPAIVATKASTEGEVSALEKPHEQAQRPVVESIRTRLRQVLSDHSSRRVEAATGHNHESIRRYLTAARVPADFLHDVCTAYSVSPSWLLLGIGTPYLSEHASRRELLHAGRFRIDVSNGVLAPVKDR